jgi:hypothetical protein
MTHSKPRAKNHVRYLSPYRPEQVIKRPYAERLLEEDRRRGIPREARLPMPSALPGRRAPKPSPPKRKRAVMITGQQVLARARGITWQEMPSTVKSNHIE